MKNNCIIKSGDFWSTRSSAAIPGMLVFVKWSGNSLLGYPMFCEASKATGECFLLDGHPEFNGLLDERWVNFGCSIKLDTHSLYARLGNSQYALNCLHGFMDGQKIPLDNGVPMFKGIGDCREHFQVELLKNLKKLAGTSFAVLTVNALRETLSCAVKETGIEALEECMDTEFITPARNYAEHHDTILHKSKITRAVCFSLVPNFSKFRTSKEYEKTEKEVTINVNGKEVQIQLNIHGQIAHYVFIGEGIDSIEMCENGNDAWQEVPKISSDKYVTKPSRLSKCKIQITFADGDCEIFDLNLNDD